MKPEQEQYAVCSQLNQYVHDLVFSFAGRAYLEGYFTVYQLDDGTRETRLCPFPVEPSGKSLVEYVEEMVDSLTERKRTLSGFAMFLSQENPAGLHEWWSLATDDQIEICSTRFIPFTNEDGVFDYMHLAASPKRAENQEALKPMLEATNLVWSMALEKGAAHLEVGELNPEAVQA